jgi:hypothetical protein
MKHLLPIILLSSFTGLHAMKGNNYSSSVKFTGMIVEPKKCKLPPAATIKEELNKQGFNDFVNKTEIDIKLGSATLPSLMVDICIKNMIKDYKKSGASTTDIPEKNDIMKIILNDQTDQWDVKYNVIEFSNNNNK